MQRSKKASDKATKKRKGQTHRGSTAESYPEQRTEIARKGGIASAAARWGFKQENAKAAVEKAPSEIDPELVKARRREIASAAAKARWAKARATKQRVKVQMPARTKRGKK